MGCPSWRHGPRPHQWLRRRERTRRTSLWLALRVCQSASNPLSSFADCSACQAGAVQCNAQSQSALCRAHQQPEQPKQPKQPKHLLAAVATRSSTRPRRLHYYYRVRLQAPDSELARAHRGPTPPRCRRPQPSVAPSLPAAWSSSRAAYQSLVAQRWRPGAGLRKSSSPAAVDGCPLTRPQPAAD